ncbi:MAG: hypothetical protein ACE5LQ_05835 [Candidatus Bipolaricaulia bacterium]
MDHLKLDRVGRNLQRLWWLHDGLWFHEVARRYGFDVANELNHATVKVVAKRAMRLASGGRPKGPLTIEEVAGYFERAAELMWAPSMMRWEGQIVDKRTMEVEVRDCYVINGLKRAGFLKNYRCACLAVRQGWFEALGIKAEQEIIKTMRDGAAFCLIRVRLEVAPTAPLK